MMFLPKVGTMVTQEQLDASRRITRRRMAWASFVSLLTFGGGVILFGLSGDPEAKRVATMAGPLGIILGSWSTITIGYMAASSFDKRNGVPD